MDSNHDTQIQNLQCYHYTTRQWEQNPAACLTRRPKQRKNNRPLLLTLEDARSATAHGSRLLAGAPGRDFGLGKKINGRVAATPPYRQGWPPPVAFCPITIPKVSVMREIRRRTRAGGAFPDGNSALMLVSARLRHIAGSAWGGKRHMDMARLEEKEKPSRPGSQSRLKQPNKPSIPATQKLNMRKNLDTICTPDSCAW